MWEYNQTTNSDELYHYGVLGMKWGRRKVRTTLTKLDNHARKQNDKFRDQLAYRTGGSQAVKRQQKNRAQKAKTAQRRADSIAIAQAKGKKKVAVLLSQIGRDMNNKLREQRQKDNRRPNI